MPATIDLLLELVVNIGLTLTVMCITGLAGMWTYVGIEVLSALWQDHQP